MANEQPRPYSGFVQVWASPTATTPRAAGRPSIVKWRMRFRSFAIGCTSVMGSLTPGASHGAIGPMVAAAASKRSGADSVRIAASSVEVARVTEKVPLSPGKTANLRYPRSAPIGPSDTGAAPRRR